MIENDKEHLMSSYKVSGTGLSALDALSHLMFTTTR